MSLSLNRRYRIDENCCHVLFSSSSSSSSSFPGATTPLGVVFYSPLERFSLLAYEVT